MICKKKVVLFLTSFSLVGCVHVQITCPKPPINNIWSQGATTWTFPCTTDPGTTGTTDPETKTITGCITNAFVESAPTISK